MTAGGAELLLTGFAPFRSFAVNPSWEAARAAAAHFGPSVVAALLPVDHEAARRELYALLDRHRPSACLCMGLTPSPEFCLEGVARKPVQFAGSTGEDVLQGNWPWPSVEAALTGSGVPWRRSCDAGAYVCESTYWALLDYRGRRGFPARAGFLHVPCISEAHPLDQTAACVRQVVGDYLDSIRTV